MPDPSSIKSKLRRELRAQRQALPPAQVSRAGTAMAAQLTELGLWQEARNIALYMSLGGELDTGPLVSLARQQGKRLYLPVVRKDGTLEFALWEQSSPLEKSHYGIPQPAESAPRLGAAQLDLICLPLVAWDDSGTRLGMGGGYYDRTLMGIDTAKVGLAYDFQRRKNLPREAWDIAMNYVATETSLHCCTEID